MPTSLFDYGIKKKKIKEGDESYLRRVQCDIENEMEYKNSSLIQTSIDIGQKNLGPSSCLICGMIYTAGVASDEKDHHSNCKKVTQLGRRVDVLRKITLFSPPSVDAVVLENFDFGMVGPSSHCTEFVRKIFYIIDALKSLSRYSIESEVHRTQFHSNKECYIAICMGSASSLELWSYKKQIAAYVLYGVAIVKRMREGHVLASLEEIWINPACVHVTLQKDIFQGMMETLKSQLIYGYCMQDSEISFGSAKMPH